MTSAEPGKTRVSFIHKQFVWVCVDPNPSNTRPEMFVEIELTRHHMRLKQDGDWEVFEEGEEWWARVVGLVGDQSLAAKSIHGKPCKNDPESIAEVSQVLAKQFVADLEKVRAT